MAQRSSRSLNRRSAQKNVETLNVKVERNTKLVMEEKSKEGTSKPVVEERRKEGNKLAKENESNKQVDNKKKRVKHFSCNGWAREQCIFTFWTSIRFICT